jgi:hypothetical protein
VPPASRRATRLCRSHHFLIPLSAYHRSPLIFFLSQITCLHAPLPCRAPWNSGDALLHQRHAPGWLPPRDSAMVGRDSGATSVVRVAAEHHDLNPAGNRSYCLRRAAFCSVPTPMSYVSCIPIAPTLTAWKRSRLDGWRAAARQGQLEPSGKGAEAVTPRSRPRWRLFLAPLASAVAGDGGHGGGKHGEVELSSMAPYLADTRGAGVVPPGVAVELRQQAIGAAIGVRRC